MDTQAATSISQCAYLTTQLHHLIIHQHLLHYHARRTRHTALDTTAKTCQIAAYPALRAFSKLWETSKKRGGRLTHAWRVLWWIKPNFDQYLTLDIPKSIGRRDAVPRAT